MVFANPDPLHPKAVKFFQANKSPTPATPFIQQASTKMALIICSWLQCVSPVLLGEYGGGKAEVKQNGVLLA